MAAEKAEIQILVIIYYNISQKRPATIIVYIARRFGFNTLYLPNPYPSQPTSQVTPFNSLLMYIAPKSSMCRQKTTKIYTKSHKMPIQLVLVSFGNMHILHNYTLLCIILNFLPLSEPIPFISQKSYYIMIITLFQENYNFTYYGWLHPKRQGFPKYRFLFKVI